MAEDVACKLAEFGQRENGVRVNLGWQNREGNGENA